MVEFTAHQQQAFDIGFGKRLHVMPRSPQPLAHRLAIGARGPAAEVLNMEARRHVSSLRPAKLFIPGAGSLTRQLAADPWYTGACPRRSPNPFPPASGPLQTARPIWILPRRAWLRRALKSAAS